MPRIDPTLPVFVYGTLRPGAARVPIARRLLREGRHLGAARFSGRLYRIHWYPGVVADDAAGMIRGDLFALPPKGNLLSALDAYERFQPHRPKRGDFRRGIHKVMTDAGPRDAWVYTYHGPVDAALRVASDDWLAM